MEQDLDLKELLGNVVAAYVQAAVQSVTDQSEDVTSIIVPGGGSSI
ncbi:MAG: hypothetical protein R3E01_05175 [Pirellulaceae bacterium]|nr:hypothetical protein [Planctomycetales bacterium]